MKKIKRVLSVYRKIYGNSIPTGEKLKNAEIVADIIIEVYDIAKNDAIKNIWRLPQLEAVIKEKYNIPSTFQDWLIDSVRKVYTESYQEGRKEA